MFLSHDDIVSSVWMRQVKKSTFRVLCFVPLVLAAYSTVAGTLWKNSSLEETLLLSSHIKPVTNFGKLAVKRKWQVSTIHIVDWEQRIHRSRSNSFAEKKIPIDVNRSNIPSIKNICGTKLVSRSFDTRTITSIWGAWECLSVNNIVPIQCHRHATSHTSRTSRPIQPLTGSNGSGTSLCGYPVPNTKCPWTPGVTKVGRLQQRSLERNHMKRTNPQTTHVDSRNIPFISYLVTLFLPLHIKVSTHTSSCIYI